MLLGISPELIIVFLIYIYFGWLSLKGNPSPNNNKEKRAPLGDEVCVCDLQDELPASVFLQHFSADTRCF